MLSYKCEHIWNLVFGEFLFVHIYIIIRTLMLELQISKFRSLIPIDYRVYSSYISSSLQLYQVSTKGLMVFTAVHWEINIHCICKLMGLFTR